MIKLLFLVRGQIFKKQTKQTKSSSSVSEQKTFNLKSTNRYLQFKKIFLQNNVMFCLHAELPQPSALRVDVGRVSPPVHLRLLTLCHLPFVSSSSSFSLRSPQPAGRSHDENTSHTHTVEKCRQASGSRLRVFSCCTVTSQTHSPVLLGPCPPPPPASASSPFSSFSSLSLPPLQTVCWVAFHLHSPSPPASSADQSSKVSISSDYTRFE